MMRISLTSLSVNIGAILATLAVMATPSQAFLLTRTTATWDNVWLHKGIIVGSQGEAPDQTNKIVFITQDDENQVRWGTPAPTPTVEPNPENQSGLGFTGINTQEIIAEEVFNLGTLKHFNKTIVGNGLAGTKADFKLSLDFDNPQIGLKTFNFSFNIDETNNLANAHIGGDCPYPTDTGKGCSDQITWNLALDIENSFIYDGDSYTLELVGFSQDSLSSQTSVTQFISQEGGTSEANLLARIIPIPITNAVSQTIQADSQLESVPEPDTFWIFTIAGFLLLLNKETLLVTLNPTRSYLQKLLAER